MIRHALANIISNAIKFTAQGTITITMNAIQELGRVRIEISDTGSGIDPKVMPKLFTKFTSKSESGAGLGLYISKEVITAHGGQISAANNENNGDGGATFTTDLLISHIALLILVESFQVSESSSLTCFLRFSSMVTNWSCVAPASNSASTSTPNALNCA